MMEFAISEAAPDAAPARRRKLSQEPGTAQYRLEERHAAVELVAVFDDGHEERSIVRRSSGRRQIRKFEARPGLRSVAVARRLTLAEWNAYCAEFPARRIRHHVVYATVEPRVEVAASAATPGVDVAATAATPRVELAAIGDRPGVYAWEVLVRRHGKAAMVRVVCPTEDGAVRLMTELDGVDAAAAIRPLTHDEYRQAVG